MEAQSKKPKRTVSSKSVLRMTANERKAEIESNSEKILELERKIEDLKQRNIELTDQNDPKL